MTAVLVKYKDLENSLEKTMETMKKRTDLEKKVVSLGMDRNLVKNLAELFDSWSYCIFLQFMIRLE